MQSMYEVVTSRRQARGMIHNKDTGFNRGSTQSGEQVLELTQPSRYNAELDAVAIERIDEPRVLSVCFEPTNLCSGRCPYCLIEHPVEEQSHARLISVLECLLGQGCVRFGLGGGEPLLRNDVYLLGAYLKERGAGVLLRTSGTVPIREEEAFHSFDWIDISLDSIDADVHTQCRPGISLVNVKRNIRRLASSNARLRVTIPLSRWNHFSLEKTLCWLHAVGVKHLRFQPLVPRGLARRVWAQVGLEEEEVRTLVDDGCRLARKLGIEARAHASTTTRSLCVVKGTGGLYMGTPNGLLERGSIFDHHGLQQIASELWQNQVDIYTLRGR